MNQRKRTRRLQRIMDPVARWRTVWRLLDVPVYGRGTYTFTRLWGFDFGSPGNSIVYVRVET
jgi:hypothetical protein